MLNRELIIGILIGVSSVLLIQYIDNQTRCNDLNKVIKILSRQAARWATASIQDENPLIAVLHGNYGAGYLWALKDIATDSQIKKTTGIDLQKFTEEVVAAQDTATRKMALLCPKFVPKRSYLTEIGGE